jgi:hypothetical protein
VEQASHEVSAEAIRALIAKAHGLLEAGDDDGLPGVDDEIFRLCRDLGCRAKRQKQFERSFMRLLIAVLKLDIGAMHSGRRGG